MAPDGRNDGRPEGRTDMDIPISLRLRRGIITIIVLKWNTLVYCVN